MKRIIVIDDNNPVRESIMNTLTNAGYVTDGSADSLDGWVKVLRGRYDLILLDIVMPGLSTAEFIEKFRGRVGLDPHLKNTKLIIITALRLSDADRKTLVDGQHVIGVLDKPFTSVELSSKVREALGEA